jgi:hypothetical protein
MTMVYRLKDLIPSANTGTPLGDVWVRAMHLRFYEGLIGRIGSAWEVLMDRAIAVKWPEHGEFEDAVKSSMDN